jgi:hypothetical protein
MSERDESSLYRGILSRRANHKNEIPSSLKMNGWMLQKARPNFLELLDRSHISLSDTKDSFILETEAQREVSHLRETSLSLSPSLSLFRLFKNLFFLNFEQIRTKQE